MSRAIGWFIGVVGAIAWLAPSLAPYDPSHHHDDHLHAPPMPPRVVHQGELHLPFVYSLTLTDRLAQRYHEDPERPRPLPWFSDDASAPVFLLGADSYGRDLLSRLLHGARVSLSLALTAVVVTLIIGVTIGGMAGYRGGWLDEVAMRGADFVLVLPVMYVALMLRSVMPLVLAPTTIFLTMAGIFAFVGWPFVARGVRSIIAAERERDYVMAARSLGASGWRILARHLLPACTGHLLVLATILLPAFILAEATLSYVGVGFSDEVPTWGTMLIEAADISALTRFPWLLTPALAIFLVALTTNIILQSDRIREPATARQ